MVTGAQHPVLVGRRAEIAQLVSLAGQAAAGQGAAVLIEGEPGIGKTALLDEAAAECARLGMRVLRGAAEDLEQRLPFAAIGNCLGVRGRAGGRGSAPDPAVARVTGLLRGEDAIGSSTAAANHELAVTEAILDLVDQWSSAGAVALILDDVQWADASSVLALHRLGEGIGQQPLLLAVAARPVPRGEAVAGLIRSLTARGASVLSIAPLDEPAVATLVENLLAAPPGPDLLRLAEGTGGNPMYVAELVAALSREQAIRHVGGVAEVNDELASLAHSLPRSLIDVIMRRLDFLPRKARDALQIAAVLGATVDVAELAAMMEVSAVDVSDVMMTAVDAGLLADTGDQLVFRHDLIREALAGSLPASVRTALHSRAGQALAAAGAAVERVAEHLLAGGTIDRRAIEWLAQTADQLMARAPQLAVLLLQRASGSAEDEAAEELRFHLVRALLWEGSAFDAEQAARTALAANHDPTRDGTLRWLLAQACYRQGRLGEAQAVADEALASPHLTQGEIGRFHGFVALCFLVVMQFEESNAAASKAIAIGEAQKDQLAIGYGYSSLGGVLMMRGEFEQTLALYDRVMAAFGGGIQPDLQMDPYYVRGYCLARLDRFAEADQALATSVRQNLQTGGVYLALSALVRTRLRFMDGRWDDALAEAQTGIDGFDPYSYGVPLQALTALIAFHRGAQADSGKVPVDDGSVGARSSRFILVWAQALVEEAQAGPREALDLLYPMWTQGGVMEHPRVVYDICPDLARLAAIVGDRQVAQELAVATQTVAEDLPSGTTRGIAQLCRGLANDDTDLLLAAAERFGQAGRPLFEGYAYESSALILAQSGQAGQAREALDKALALYGHLDAAWDTARAEARLRQSGIRRGVRGRRKRPKHGWEALTETENKVVLLVADGLSNPEVAAQMFLSRRTVQTHVSSILNKLGLRSRLELAISASRRSG